DREGPRESAEPFPECDRGVSQRRGIARWPPGGECVEQRRSAMADHIPRRDRSISTPKRHCWTAVRLRQPVRSGRATGAVDRAPALPVNEYHSAIPALIDRGEAATICDEHRRTTKPCRFDL